MKLNKDLIAGTVIDKAFREDKYFVTLKLAKKKKDTEYEVSFRTYEIVEFGMDIRLAQTSKFSPYEGVF